MVKFTIERVKHLPKPYRVVRVENGGATMTLVAECSDLNEAEAVRISAQLEYKVQENL